MVRKLLNIVLQLSIDGLIACIVAEPEPQPNNAGGSEGYSLWSRVAEAASSLTINVNLAWASSIVTYTGEGMSSHLYISSAEVLLN